MRILSVRQPWAWLLVHGIKDIENRTYATHYRGPILIQASAAPAKAFGVLLEELRSRFSIPFPEIWTYGAVVGQVELVECVIASSSPWFEGPIGWQIANARPCYPFPAKGALGLRQAPQELIERVRLTTHDHDTVRLQDSSKSRLACSWFMGVPT
jgi:hypothetical protein